MPGGPTPTTHAGQQLFNSLKQRLDALETFVRSGALLGLGAAGSVVRDWGPFQASSGTLASPGNESQVTVTVPSTTGASVFGGMQDGHLATEIGWRWDTPAAGEVRITFHSLGPDTNISGTLVFWVRTVG